MGDAAKNWMIRRSGELKGPYTEFELRRKLVGSDVRGCEVRQGESRWFPAIIVLAKFKELARAGIYLRRGDRVEGPYTAARTLKLLRETTACDFDARVGADGFWISGDNLLLRLERLAEMAAQTVEPRVVEAESEKKPSDTIGPAHLRCGVSEKNSDQSGAKNHEPMKPTDDPRLSHRQVLLGKIDGMAAPTPPPANRSANIESARVSNDPVPCPTQDQQESQSSEFDVNQSARIDRLADNESTGYPRLPDQQRPIMYVMPGAFIATWGIAAFASALISLMSGGLGVAAVMPWMTSDDPAFGVAPRLICNIVFMTLCAIMTLGSVSMIMRRNLTLARASAVLATIPCVGCLAMPFGIWACLSLFTRDAGRDFS